MIYKTFAHLEYVTRDDFDTDDVKTAHNLREKMLQRTKHLFLTTAQCMMQSVAKYRTIRRNFNDFLL